MGEEAKKEEEASIPTPEEIEASLEAKPKEEEKGGDPDLTPEAPNYEEQASAKGWRPEDEYEGDTPWVDAKEFVGRQPLFDALHKSNKKIKDLTSTVENLVDHNRKVEASTRKQVLSELEQRKIAAMGEEDHATVVAVDKEIREVEKEEEVAEAAPRRTQEFSEFLENNSWYEDNGDMRDHSIVVGKMYMEKNPDAFQADMLKHVEKSMRKSFPTEFAPAPNLKRKAAAAVASPKGGSAKPKDKNVLTFADLTYEEKSVVMNTIRGTDLDRDEYVAQIGLYKNKGE